MFSRTLQRLSVMLCTGTEYPSHLVWACYLCAVVTLSPSLHPHLQDTTLTSKSSARSSGGLFNSPGTMANGTSRHQAWCGRLVECWRQHWATTRQVHRTVRVKENFVTEWALEHKVGNWMEIVFVWVCVRVRVCVCV